MDSTEVKECSTCKKVKSVKDFHTHFNNQRNKSYVLKECKECNNIKQRTYRKESGLNERLRVSKKQLRDETKKKAIEYKGGKCEHCGGVFHQAAFDFHHVDPSTKDIDPGLMMHRKWELLVKELDKCILLCSNCHRIHHYEEKNN